MSAADKAQIIVLDTGLFPDRDKVDAALATIGADRTVKRIDLEPSQMDQAQWDLVVEELLAASRVITI